MDITERTVSVNGVEIFTRSTGESPSTVILHGGPGAHHDYLLPQFDDLHRESRPLLFYDQRGGGRSPVDRDSEVGWKELVEDLKELIDELVGGPAAVVGYSFGGLLALLFASRYPTRVSRLALVSPAPATREGREEFERRFAVRSRSPEITAARQELQDSDLKKTDPEAYRRRAFQLSVAGYFHRIENVGDLTPFRVTGRTQRSVWESLGDYDIRDQISRIEKPSIVLHGRHDPIPIETASDTAQRLNAEFVEMSQSGHCPHVEEREKFATLIDSFLSSHE